jgi:trehalose 6-phosphate synthase
MAASGSRSVLVAANRGPVSISTGPGGREEVQRGGGGLVSGMVSALSEVDGLWVCAALNDRERAAARRAPDGHLADAGYDTGRLDVRMLPLDPSTFARAYNGIANSTIWFLQHLLYDSANTPVFDAGWRRLWAAYERYNRSFADALAAEAAPGAKVMVQDYHLNLAPRQLRERRDDVRIAHFTHTPWAPPEQFAMLPGRGRPGDPHRHARRGPRRVPQPALVGGVPALLRPVPRRRGGPDRRDGAVEGRTVRTGVHPLGTAAGEIRDRAHGEDAEAGLAQLRDVVGDRKVISRVDRTELSKNIVRGLLAYRELLRFRPEWHGRVVHIAYAYPSRTDLPEYREYAASVQRAGREIEQEFGTDDWNPVLLEIANDYRGRWPRADADVLLVNPVRQNGGQEGVVSPTGTTQWCCPGRRRRRRAARTRCWSTVRRDPDRGACTRRCPCRPANGGSGASGCWPRRPRCRRPMVPPAVGRAGSLSPSRGLTGRTGSAQGPLHDR